jgi:hypothetical protein
VIALVPGILLGLGVMAAGGPRANADIPLDGINMQYHGDRLIEHVKVVPLLLGSSWSRSRTPAYLKNFLQTLFTDGRYMANVAQYNAGGYHIGNGTAMDPVVDLKVLDKITADYAVTGLHYQITDQQIRAEIQAQITAGKLPKPDADTLYVVCFQYDVVVIDGYASSETDFGGYHQYSTAIGAAYAVACPTFYSSSLPLPNSPTGYTDSYYNRELTGTITHELAEAVTDPEGDLQSGTGGWFTDGIGVFGIGRGQEIADIPTALANAGFITDDQYYDLLTGADGTKYAVQRIWSMRDKSPVAFATVSSP